MAKSRMINKALISKDMFLQLSGGTQLLYFHLCMNADDDGFVDNAITLLQQLPVKLEDLKTLIEKGYVIIMEDYLYVITHWRVHNNIDRKHYTGTSYIDYLRKLYLSESKVYSLIEGKSVYEDRLEKGYFDKGIVSKEIFLSSKYTQNDLEMNSSCTQNVPQLSKVKLSKDKISIDKVSKDKLNEIPEAIQNFLDSHKLISIKPHFFVLISEFFEDNQKDKLDIISYLDYVYKYTESTHNPVPDKLFFKNSLTKDILTRFYKDKKPDSHWPELCPVCNEYHNINGDSELCILQLSKQNSSERIEEARRYFNLSESEKEKEISNTLNFFRPKTFKGEI